MCYTHISTTSQTNTPCKHEHVLIHLFFNNTLNTFLLTVISALKIFLFGRKKGNVLFNDTLNTFCLWLYGIGHGKGPLK